MGASGPIIALAAIRQFWDSYGTLVISAAGLFLILAIFFWILLEALFRGGWKAMWLYTGTAAARTILLWGTAGIFVLLSTRDETGGTLIVGAVVTLGMWFLVGLLETVLRKDAVDLLATSLLPLSAVMGCLWIIESGLGFIVLGSAAIALFRTTELALGALFAVFVVMFWMIVHSYLVAVRYSAIDIMRRNVFRT